jgi:hypothetical protein
MAQILRKRDEVVALVAMFDTWGPDYPRVQVGRILVLASIAAVRDRIREMLRAIDLNASPANRSTGNRFPFRPSRRTQAASRHSPEIVPRISRSVSKTLIQEGLGALRPRLAPSASGESTVRKISSKRAQMVAGVTTASRLPTQRLINGDSHLFPHVGKR